jgi:hypothetical protein
MSGQYQERKEYFKQFREKSQERLQQERHDYYDKDRIKESAKQWKKENPSTVWVQKQEYFEKNSYYNVFVYYNKPTRQTPFRVARNSIEYSIL